MTNTDFILLIIAIVLALKDCKGANYYDELKGIKNELYNIKSELAKRESEKCEVE